MTTASPSQRRTSASTDRRDSSASRGVSDAIGFTLMFSIIIFGVGVVSLAGASQLATLSETEEVQSAEQGMQSVAATLDPIISDGDLERSFTVAYSNSNVWVNETELNVTTGDGWDEYEAVTVNALEQRFDRSGGDVTVRYEGGGVFRSDGAGARFDPPVVCREAADGRTALVTLVNLTLADRSGLYVSQGFDPDLRFDEFAGTTDPPITSTDSAIDFQASLVDSERNLTEFEDEERVIVNVAETSGREQWIQYFEGQDGWVSVPGEEAYQCDADQMLVRLVTVELDVVDPQFAD